MNLKKIKMTSPQLDWTRKFKKTQITKIRKERTYYLPYRDKNSKKGI